MPENIPTAANASKPVFCAACQAVTEHDVTVDKNHEIVATCKCGRFLKLPLVNTADELQNHLDAHHQANKGQVSAVEAAAAEAKVTEHFNRLMGLTGPKDEGAV